MIHEIYPKKYDPTYKNRKMTGSDYLLSYEKDGILVKRKNGIISLPKYSDYAVIIKEGFNKLVDEAMYLFEISGEFFYEITLPEEISEDILFCRKLEDISDERKEEDFFYIRIHSFRELDPLDMVFAGATGYHIRNWKQVTRFCGCCGGKTEASKTERAFVHLFIPLGSLKG